MATSSKTVAASASASVIKINEGSSRLQLRSGGNKGLAAAATAAAPAVEYLSMEVVASY